MKKVFTLLFTLALTTAFAEGYQVNLQSAKQAGMAHTGTAMKLGAESMHFNPAMLVYMDKSVDLSAGISGVMAKVKYSDDMGYNASTKNSMSTPMYVFAGFNVIKERLAVGLAVTTPYGSALDWGNNWKGADVIQNISLRSFVFQPTASVKITDGLSFGAGLMISTGSFSLSRAMLPAGALSAMNPGMFPPAEYGDVIPASAKLSGSAKTAVGFNLGLSYVMNDKFTIGVSYRSKMLMKVDQGEAEINYASKVIEGALGALSTFPKLNEGTFNAQLPLPSNFTVGLTYCPTERWVLSYDMQFVGWKAYDKLNVKFTQNVLQGYSINAPKNYKNTIIYRMGAQFVATERLDVRFGAYYDETPVRSNTYNPETPGANKMGLTAGLSFEPYENLYIDFAFSFIKGFEKYGTYTYTNGLQQVSTFEGNYKSTAFTPSLGLRFAF